jgi:hypothetical protein
MAAVTTRPPYFTFYRKPSFVLMCLSLGAVVIIDLKLIGLSAHSEGPLGGILYPLHLLLITIGSLAFVKTIMEMGAAAAPASQSTAAGQADVFPAGLSVTAQQIWIWLMIGLGFIFTAIFVLSPQLFTYLALEDGIVETASALGYFLAVGVLIAIAVVLRKYRGPYRMLWMFLLVGGGLVLFVMGGEEISWGQRIFNLATPDALMGNHQRELNLHNFASKLTEDVIYSLAVVWLAFIPFINQRTGILNKLRSITIFIPAQYLVFIGAITTIYYSTEWIWYAEPFHFYLLATLFMLFSYNKWSNSPLQSEKALIGAMAVLMLGSQVAFIVLNDKLGRNWDLTEYRELFIPMGYLLYTLDIFQRFRRLAKDSGEALAAR